MKKLLFLLLSTLSICGLVYAAAPSVEEGNRVKFTAESQETTTKFAISSIAWVSASGDEVSGTGGFILEDSNNVDIASCEATTVSDQCHFTFPEPVIVDGLKVPHLDGDLYIYGKRK